MRITSLVTTLGLLALSSAVAQGPLYDKIKVNLPYPVTVRDTVLQPGQYTIRQHEDQAGSRILHFYSKDGMKLETTAMAIPALDNKTPEHTKLVLEHIGSDYYLNKVWVQGKDYGYEIPLPREVRMRMREQTTPATVTAQYTKQETTQEAKNEEKAEEKTEVAQAAPPPAPEPEATPAPAPAPPPVREQAEQAPAPAPAPTPAPAPAMPKTAANWFNLALGGGLLALSGLALRRARA